MWQWVAGGNIQRISYIPQTEQHSPFGLMLLHLGYACMHVCMYVFMYVCMYVGMYVCMYVGMYVCMYVGCWLTTGKKCITLYYVHSYHINRHA